MGLKVYSWNVNGIRAVEQKGFSTWLLSEKPDVVFLQEIKALEEQVPESITQLKTYHQAFFPAERKGYSGTAVFWKKSLPNPKVIKGIGLEKFDCEGRSLGLEWDQLKLWGCYFPNGSRDHSRVDYKLEFSEAMLKQTLKDAKKKHVALFGDINTAHQEIDLTNPKTNHKTTGFLPREREWVSHAIGSGLVDVFRQQHGEENGHYTWWSYRNNCRAKNVGWRIDYFLCDTKLATLIKQTNHLPEVMGSDHCPIMMEIKGKKTELL